MRRGKKLRKKPLIMVSLCAVVLLVMGSLSNVVGYQSVKSIVNDSPLFQTRIQRATNQQQNILDSQYIRKREKSILLIQKIFPDSCNFQKILKRIIKMDSNTINWLRNTLFYQLRPNTKIGNVNYKQIINILQQLKTKLADANIYKGISGDVSSINFECTANIPQWEYTVRPLFCVLHDIIDIILFIIYYNVCTILGRCETVLLCTVDNCHL